MKTSRGPNRVSLPRALSKLGYASRAQAFLLIQEGRVSVNGRVVTNPNAWVQLNRDRITIDEKEVFQEEFRYLLFHKPTGVTTTRSDERNNPTVYDVLGPAARGLSSVGRLDQDTSGLLLVTNDHQLANALTDPSNRIPKTYLATLDRALSSEHVTLLSSGVTIRIDGKSYLTKPAIVRSRPHHRVEITITEGKNRQVRKMFAALGYEIMALHRITFGPLELGSLAARQHRPLTIAEVESLRLSVRRRKGRTKERHG